MRLIDTHSHLYDEAFEADREETLQRAVDGGVGLLLLPAIDSESHAAQFDLCRRHTEVCRPMMGLHPTSINDNPHWREELQRVEQLLTERPEGIAPFVAVGEIGLDFYWSSDFVAEQEEAFFYHCRLAAVFNVPVAIHTRASWDRMIELIEKEYAAAKERGELLRGVFHAYSEDAATYRRLKESTEGNFLFGIGGVVTYKKSVVAEAVREMALEDIVLETDCPYLTPVPHRGKRNESGYLSYVCEKVADLLGVTAEEVAEVTSRNAERMFVAARS